MLLLQLKVVKAWPESALVEWMMVVVVVEW
jgi:hypothetical protein